jgi:hypothetical protein
MKINLKEVQNKRTFRRLVVLLLIRTEHDDYHANLLNNVVLEM